MTLRTDSPTPVILKKRKLVNESLMNCPAKTKGIVIVLSVGQNPLLAGCTNFMLDHFSFILFLSDYIFNRSNDFTVHCIIILLYCTRIFFVFKSLEFTSSSPSLNRVNFFLL